MSTPKVYCAAEPIVKALGGKSRRHFLDDCHGEGIGLADIVDRPCEWALTRCKMSPGNMILALAI